MTSVGGPKISRARNTAGAHPALTGWRSVPQHDSEGSMTTDSDRFATFAAAHLRTEAEHVVYSMLAGAPETAVSATDLSAPSHLQEYDFDVVLRQFAAAGIVVPIVGEGHEVRYRLNESMAYLYEAHPRGKRLIDPVCGMPVLDPGRHREGGLEFCSLPCKVRWRVASRQQP